MAAAEHGDIFESDRQICSEVIFAFAPHCILIYMEKYVDKVPLWTVGEESHRADFW